MYNGDVETRVAEEIETFFTQFNHQTYKKGEILIRASEAPSGVFFLKNGNVKQYTISKNGVEAVLNIFKPMSFFPMSWAINNTPNIYFYEAMTSLDVWRAPQEKVTDFLKQEPEITYDLLSRVFKGTDGLLTRMSYLMAGTAYSRLALELVIQGKRIGKQTGNHVQLKISESDLAAEVGMRRETVSRELKILKEKGLVSFHNKILTISNLEDLERELAGGI